MVAHQPLSLSRERGELSNMYMGERRRRTMEELTVEMGGLFVADGWSVFCFRNNLN